jgi:glycosyltransferase involved in cell wall biosynthesis
MRRAVLGVAVANGGGSAVVSQHAGDPSAESGPAESEVPRRLAAAGELAGRVGDATTRLDGVTMAVVNWRDPWQPVAGGAEEYAWQISRQLSERGADVTFLTSRAHGQAVSERRDGIALRRMGAKFTVYARVMLWLLLHRRRFDAVIDCMNGIPFFCPVVLPRRVPVICVVHHVHDRQFFVHFAPWLARFGRFLEGPVSRWVYRHQAVATVSPSTVTAMRDRLRWRGPVSVVPNGCPSVQPLMAVSRPAEGDPAIVCVGRLVLHKRVEQVADLAAELNGRWPGLRVHVVGRGPEYEPLLGHVAAAGLSDRVRLHGFLPQAAKNTLVATSYLHVSASQFEGWGLSVIEAAALGVPTVAYDVDGLRDAIRHGHTGWLVRDGQRLSDVVAGALAELADPSRRAQVQKACREWASLFTWAESGERMARLVTGERALDPRARRRRVGGPAYVVQYLTDGEESAVLVPAQDRTHVCAHLRDRGVRILDVRPATAVEMLFGRAETP